jgi:DNA-binding NtrC family response regulator
MPTIAGPVATSVADIIGSVEFVPVVPASSSPVGRGAPRPYAKRDADLHHRLAALSAGRLAEIILDLVDRTGEPLMAVVEAALRRFDEAPAEVRVEEAEPFMVGNSPAMQRVYDQIRKFGGANAPVLVTGESGTGKELVARAIHERSAYGGGPFVAINCAALPPTLIAAELFGHEKGAFTGAIQRRIGRLETAHGGTIFLDEIGDLPLEQQAHLLRFLQEGTIDRVGGRQPIEVNARVICATNVDLGRAIGEGRFREDLYYRLHVLSLHLPSLRARGDDIELLATFFLRKFANDHGRAVAGFSDDAWRHIREHGWPGNVRELISSVRRAIVMADTPWITARDLGLDEHRLPQRQAKAVPPAASRPVIDEQRLRMALARNGDNVTAAARELSLSRMTVYRLMRRYALG